jgi:hypothetical protein
MGDWRNTKNEVKWFLRLLEEGGVDVEEFGHKENALHDEGETSWMFWIDISTTDGFKNYCDFEMLELRIGETPDDLHMVFEDLYVSAGLAADFWTWVEDDFKMAIPGAWCDD